MKFSNRPECYCVIDLPKISGSGKERSLVIRVDNEQIDDSFFDRMIPIKNGHRVEMNRTDIMKLINTMIEEEKASNYRKTLIDDIFKESFGETKLGYIIEYKTKKAIDTSDIKFLFFIDDNVIIPDFYGIIDKLSGWDVKNESDDKLDINIDDIDNHVYILGLIERGNNLEDNQKYVILDILDSESYTKELSVNTTKSFINKIFHKYCEYDYLTDIRRQFVKHVGVNYDTIKIFNPATKLEAESFKFTYELNHKFPAIGDVLYYTTWIPKCRKPEFKLLNEPRVTHIGKMHVDVN